MWEITCICNVCCWVCALQVWDPEALADTSTAGLYHHHKLTPYADRKLHGRVVATFVRGHQVFAAPGQGLGSELPHGAGAGVGLSPRVCGRTVTKCGARGAS